MLTIDKGNLSPSVADTISIDGVPFDLTGCSVTFNMRPSNSSTVVVTGAAVIVDALTGEVRYDWNTGDTDVEGQYAFWFDVTLPSTEVSSTPEEDLQIVDHTPSASALCTIQDVHLAMEIPTTDTSLDNIISEYIDEASATIMKATRREFAPVTTATRRFKITSNRSHRVVFNPYDLQSLTELLVNSDQPQGAVITSDDYVLEPFPNNEGVYTALVISPWIPIVSPRQLKFGYAYCDITGTWGFPSVPEQVKRAAVITVRTWLRRDAQALAGDIGGSYYSGVELPAQLPQTYALPAAARKLLAPYARTIGVI